jgi:glycosyltransferase involved in cell wall biosynthesis
MPVHNGLPHLDAAIESILGQTFPDFEFVILDDGSTDGSTERLREWAAKDPRIRLLEVERNLGPALSSDMVARAARAPIVARMDADDISYPRRMAEQLELLRRQPETGLVAALSDFIDSSGRILRPREFWRIARRSTFVPFAHGVTMYRRAVFDRVGGYREQCEFWEDHDLVLRIAAVSRIMIIPHELYQYRLSTTSTRIASDQERVERAVDLAYRSAARLGQHRDYEDLLSASAQLPDKVNPRVFVSLGSQLLWAGGRPRLFRRLLRRARLAPDLWTAAALVWTAWASASPGSLRAFLRLLIAGRNSAAQMKVHGDQPIEWRPSFTLPPDVLSSPAGSKSGT